MAEPVNTPSNGHWYPPPAKSDADLTKKVKKNIAKNTSKVPPSKSVQPCPLAKPEPKFDPNNKICNYTMFKVSKPKRSFDLIVSRTTPSTQRTYGIVAGFKNVPAKVTVELQGPVGPCNSTHNHKRSFNTGSGTFKILPASTENKLELEVTSSNKIQVLPWGFTPDKYVINANRCGHLSQFSILAVYPDTVTDITLGFNFGEKKSRLDDKTVVSQRGADGQGGLNKKAEGHVKSGKTWQKTTPNSIDNSETKKGFHFAGSIKYDGKSYAIDVVFNRTIKTLQNISGLVQKAKVTLEDLKKNMAKAAATAAFDNPFDVTIKYPNVDVNFGGSWKEDAGSPSVTYHGHLKVSAKPLIGLSLKWNITATVLQMFPGGIALQKLKKKMVDGFLELYLKAGVEGGGDISLTFENLVVKKVTGKIYVKVPFAAELVLLKADIDVYFIHATVEVKVYVESGFIAEIKYSSETKNIIGDARMDDVVVWLSSYQQFGGKKKSNDKNSYAPQVTSDRTGPEEKKKLWSRKFDGKLEFLNYDFKKA